MVILLCSSSHGFIAFICLLAVVSWKYQLMKNICHPLLNLPLWRESNESFSCRAPVYILGSGEAVRLMQICALAMCSKVCSQGGHSSARKHFQQGSSIHYLQNRGDRLQRCPCSAWTSQSRLWPWDLSSWGLWRKVLSEWSLPQQLLQVTISETKHQYQHLPFILKVRHC